MCRCLWSFSVPLKWISVEVMADFGVASFSLSEWCLNIRFLVHSLEASSRDSFAQTLEVPSADPNIPQMEKEFESRDMNNQLYNMNSDNTQFKDHAENEKRRIDTLNQPSDDEYYSDEEDFDEYELEEMPLWKKIVNEVRVPLFIFLMILVFMSSLLDKSLIQKIPMLGNQYNEINTKGFLAKAIVCSLIAYVIIRFIRV